MTLDKINSGLIDAMREKIPKGANLARVLMDLLFIGKEAVYRRLRGEVPFTLAEAAIVSGRLGISLDKLVGASSAGNAIFDLNLVRRDDPVETYYDMVSNYLRLVDVVADCDDSQTGSASNMVPQAFTLGYEMLSRFRFFKWVYQSKEGMAGRRLDEMELPEKLFAKQKEYVQAVQNFRHTCYVWDSTLFMSLVNDIKYFAEVGLVTPGDVGRLHDELLALIDDMEQMATRGAYLNGNSVEVFVSNINFEATYSYIEARNYKLSMLRVFSINSMTSKDNDVFVNLKEWIQSLKKFAILISQSGEMQRIRFFVKQREYVKTLL